MATVDRVELDPMLTCKEAAEQWCVSEKCVRGWVLKRQIPFVKLLGRTIRIRQSVVDKVIAEGQTEVLGAKKPNMGAQMRKRGAA